MTKEHYYRQLEVLQTEGDREEAIRLCREYEKFCRENGDLDELASVLDTLSWELGVSEHPDARKVFDDLLELRKALAHNNLKTYGQAYALLLHRKSYTWAESNDEAIACQKEAMDIYKHLGLYDEKGFDIELEDAFGYLGKLYCFNGEYEMCIRYTRTALERFLKNTDTDSSADFQIALYYRRLGISHLCLGDTDAARNCLQKALDYFNRAEQAEPDPYTFPDVIGSCRILLEECNGRTFPDEYYQQWMIG